MSYILCFAARYGTVCDVEPQRQVREGDLLWTPGPDRAGRANVTAFIRWLARERGLDFEGTAIPRCGAGP
jgi:hypothetical protein